MINESVLVRFAPAAYIQMRMHDRKGSKLCGKVRYGRKQARHGLGLGLEGCFAWPLLLYINKKFVFNLIMLFDSALPCKEEYQFLAARAFNYESHIIFYPNFKN
jgi:hypothetical protein